MLQWCSYRGINEYERNLELVTTCRMRRVAMDNSGLYQRLDDRRATTSCQLQHQCPSALDIASHAIDSLSLCAMVSMATPIDAIPSTGTYNTAEAAQ